jgi:hypothetical protein
MPLPCISRLKKAPFLSQRKGPWVQKKTVGALRRYFNSFAAQWKHAGKKIIPNADD